MLSREVEAHGLADPDTRQDGAWLRWNNPAYGGPSTQLNVLITPITDLGMRVRFRGQRVKDEEYPQFILRKGPDNASPNLFIRDGKLQIRFTKSGYPVLAEASLIEPLPAGKEYIAEFYAIGQQLIARVNGQTLTAHLDLPPEAGSFTIYGASWDYFKDAEVINLDGLPEAEALKLVGLDAAASAPSQR
jgi:hypothetical protein